MAAVDAGRDADPPRRARPGRDDAERLTALGIDVVDGPATAVEAEHDRVTGVRLTGGRVVPCRHVVIAPRFEARAGLLDRLGLATADFLVGDHVLGTHVPADATGATAVPGVWVAGNVTDPAAPVIGAAAAGVRAAHGINLSLVTEDADAAVAAAALAAPG